MGCDIHFHVEKYTSEEQERGPCADKQKIRESKIDGILEDIEYVERPKKWISVDKWEYDEPFHNDDGHWSIDDYYYRGRDYDLFTKLADVRSYGSNSGVLIDGPRGIPDDASKSYKHMCDQWNGDAHSHSYFTLTELLSVDSNKWESGFTETINKMKEIDSNTDNVRCCFFFDN